MQPFDCCPMSNSRKPLGVGRPIKGLVSRTDSLDCFFDAACHFRDFTLQKMIYDSVEIVGNLLS